jgi:hypothetical protein
MILRQQIGEDPKLPIEMPDGSCRILLANDLVLSANLGEDNALTLINLPALIGSMEIRAAVHVFSFGDLETDNCGREYTGRQASYANDNSSYAHLVFRLAAFFSKKCD